MSVLKNFRLPQKYLLILSNMQKLGYTQTEAIKEGLDLLVSQKKAETKTKPDNPWASFAGSLTNEEADEWLRNIKDGRKEQIKLQKRKDKRLAKLWDM